MYGQTYGNQPPQASNVNYGGGPPSSSQLPPTPGGYGMTQQGYINDPYASKIGDLKMSAPYDQNNPQTPPVPQQLQNNGYQQQPNGCQQQPNGFQQQPNGNQQQSNGFQQQNGYQQQQHNVYQQQPNGYQQQSNSYQQQPNGYQQQSNGLQQQPNGLQQQQNGYQQQPCGVQQQSNGVQQQPNVVQQQPNVVQQQPNVVQQQSNGLQQQQPNGYQQQPNMHQQQPNGYQQQPNGYFQQQPNGPQQQQNGYQQQPNIVQQQPNAVQQQPNVIQQQQPNGFQQQPNGLQQQPNGFQQQQPNGYQQQPHGVQQQQNGYQQQQNGYQQQQNGYQQQQNGYQQQQNGYQQQQTNGYQQQQPNGYQQQPNGFQQQNNYQQQSNDYQQHGIQQTLSPTSNGPMTPTPDTYQQEPLQSRPPLRQQSTDSSDSEDDASDSCEDEDTFAPNAVTRINSELYMHVNPILLESGPPQFSLSNCKGRKKAVLIGINYLDSERPLSGCINDANNMKTFLTEIYGFKEKNIRVLTDDLPEDSEFYPSRENILENMRWLVANSRPNDSFFFHFSGHGSHVEDEDGDEEDGQDEAICPADHAEYPDESGLIIDDLMHSVMVKPLVEGCRLTAIFDSCHSGTALDLPYIYSSRGVLKRSRSILKQASKTLLRAGISLAMGDKLSAFKTFIGLQSSLVDSKIIRERNREALFSPADVVMFAGCKDTQYSFDAQFDGAPTGAMSYAFTSSLRKDPTLTYNELLKSIRSILRYRNTQRPQMSSSHPIDVNLQFIC